MSENRSSTVLHPKLGGGPHGLGKTLSINQHKFLVCFIYAKL